MTAAGLPRVLGEELRRERGIRGWTRDELQHRLAVNVSRQTVATWELGTRSVTVVRFVELCHALEVWAPELLARSLHRATGRFDDLQLNLHAVVCDERAELEPLRRWAESQLGPERTTIRLSPAAVNQMAELCGLAGPELVAALAGSRVT